MLLILSSLGGLVWHLLTKRRRRSTSAEPPTTPITTERPARSHSAAPALWQRHQKRKRRGSARRLRLEQLQSRDMCAIDLAYEEVAANEVRIHWEPQAGATAYHAQIRSVETQQAAFSSWVYGTSLQLPLAPGSYVASVAAPGQNYEELPVVVQDHRFQISITNGTLAKIEWPQHSAGVYYAQVRDEQTSQNVFAGWLYGNQLQLRLRPGEYTVQAAAPGEQLLSRKFQIEQPTVGDGALYLGPGHAWVYWNSLGEASPYLVRTYNTADMLLQEEWVYQNHFELQRATDDYVIQVAASGAASVTINAFVSDFSQKGFTPIAPLAAQHEGQVDFSWKAEPGATIYYFQLYTVNWSPVTGFWAYHNSATAMLSPGDYRWRAIPLNERSEQGKHVDWFPLHVADSTQQEPLAPVADGKNLSITVNTETGLILGADHVANDDFRYEIISAPEHGQLVLGNNDRIVTYIPTADFIGRDRFFFRAVTGTAASNVAEVTLLVERETDPLRSYYVPGQQTIDVTTGTPTAAMLSGATLPTDLLVGSSFGRLIERIAANGQTMWRYQKGSDSGDVSIFNGRVVTHDLHSLLFLNTTTGRLEDAVEFDEAIEFVSSSDQGLLIGFSGGERQRVVLWQPAVGIVWENPHDVNYPRWATLDGDQVVIADTFNMRVYGVNRTTDEMTFSLPIVFPNDVRFLSSNELLITEEHVDRVSKYNLTTGERQAVFGSPFWPDLSVSADNWESLVESLAIDISDLRTKSKSSVSFAGPNTLYSPNGAIQLADGSYYIADTDNHRVLHVSPTGELLSQLTGFNNPSKVAVL